MNKLKEIGKRLNAVTLYLEDADANQRDKWIAIKDNFSTKGIETSASCRILAGYIPPFDATVIKKLKEAGYIMCCKTTLDELAMGGSGLTPKEGITHNPYDLNRIAGGSSSGSAALVGSGVIDLALGSDTGDSIRKPASYCGIVGVKPTYGRISRYGVIPYASSLDHVGFFTRNVMQAATLLKALAGRDDLDMTSSFMPLDDYTNISGQLAHKKVAVITNLLEAKKDDASKEHFLKLLAELPQHGVEVRYVTLNDQLLQTCLPVYYLIANCEATANHANLDGLRFGKQAQGANLDELMINSRSEGLGSLVKKRFVIGNLGLDDQHQQDLFVKAQKVRHLLVKEYDKAFAGVDAILALAANGVAPKIEADRTDKLNHDAILADNHLVLQNFNGYPSMTLPLGFDGHLPYGLNITTRAFSERLMFDIALGLEKIIDFETARKEIMHGI